MFTSHLVGTSLLTQGRRNTHRAKHPSQSLNLDQGGVISTPTRASTQSLFLFLCRERSPSYFKIRLVVLLSLNVTVTRKGFQSLPWVKPCSKTLVTCHTVGLSGKGDIMTVRSRHWGEMSGRLQQHLHSCEQARLPSGMVL